jgi:deoxyribodipyrimidine photo-lyase
MYLATRTYTNMPQHANWNRWRSWMSIDDRTTRLNELPIAPGRAVVYWMQRSQRSSSNPALNTAIEQANELRQPVVCYFGLDDSYPQATERDYRFVLEGLHDVALGLRERNVGLVVRREQSVRGIVRLAAELKASLVVTDESHLRLGRRRRRHAASLLTELDIPLWSVDNDVVVPMRVIGREHYAARTIRPQLHRLRDQYLHPIPDPPAGAVPPQVDSGVDLEDLDGTLALLRVDRGLPRGVRYVGGERAAQQALERFVMERLVRYGSDRNDASIDVTSNLSPYFHFGHMDPWTAALSVRRADAPEEAKQSFLEELLVRRELASNFTFYNKQYDTLAGLPKWARATLNEHANDKREQVYTLTQLAEARTGDDLWNASQRELVLTGSMHGWVRMYWGKRILEWVQSPAEALSHTLHLNNLYALDGRDPVSFANILWCYGKHDRPWPRRPIFGTVRSMTRSGANRKFDVSRYIERIDALGATSDA